MRWGAEPVGVTLNTFSALAELSTRYRPAGETLMLGRQAFRSRQIFRRWSYQRQLARFRKDLSLRQLEQPDGYGEALFRGLGFGEIQTLDASDYEFDRDHGGLVCDLNYPVPESLHNRFDFIFDGGTLEHVFNVPQALANVFVMLKTEGRMFGVNPLNDWPGHGMYQFTAELIYSFWKRMAGCEVVSCTAVGWPSGRYRKSVADPALGSRRTSYRSWRSPFGRVAAGRLILQYEIRKPAGARLAGIAQQSDYVSTWASGGRAA